MLWRLSACQLQENAAVWEFLGETVKDREDATQGATEHLVLRRLQSTLCVVLFMCIKLSMLLSLSEILAVIERKLFLSGKPIASTVYLSSNEFYHAGLLMVTSVLQGGPAPSFLDHGVYQYLTKQPLSVEGNDAKYKDATKKVLYEHLLAMHSLVILRSLNCVHETRYVSHVTS